MPKLNARNKGTRGELEASEWLQRELKLEKAPRRNLEQVRSGGYDLKLAPFVFEVKRVESLHLNAWWAQCKKATEQVKSSSGVDFSVDRYPTLPSGSEGHTASENLMVTTDTKWQPVVMFRQNRKPWSFLISAKEIGVNQGYLLVSERVFLNWAVNKITVS